MTAQVEQVEQEFSNEGGLGIETDTAKLETVTLKLKEAEGMSSSLVPPVSQGATPSEQSTFDDPRHKISNLSNPKSQT